MHLEHHHPLMKTLIEGNVSLQRQRPPKIQEKRAGFDILSGVVCRSSFVSETHIHDSITTVQFTNSHS